MIRHAFDPHDPARPIQNPGETAGYRPEDGVLRLGGRRTRLVLLICGENNALNTEGRHRSTLYPPGPGLNETPGDRWVALNPAHSPYWLQIARKGFAKVGSVGGGGETMARTFTRRTPYSDGTSPPLAFVHANHFLSNRPSTLGYASVAFGPEGRLTPRSTIEGEIPTTGAVRGSDNALRPTASRIDLDGSNKVAPGVPLGDDTGWSPLPEEENTHDRRRQVPAP